MAIPSLWTQCSEASGEDMLLMAYVDACTTKFYFLQVVSCGPISCSSQKILRMPWRNGCLYKKGSLGKDMPSIWTLVAACHDLVSCFCLVRASEPTINQLMWPLPTTRLVSLLAWRLHALSRGSILESSGSWAQLHCK
jgi:hypothetical protein